MSNGAPPSRNSRTSRARGHVRRGSLSVVLWAFGLATSLSLLGMWGRAVTVDTPTVTASAQEIIDADAASERVNDWFEQALAGATGTESETVQAIASEIEARPEYGAAVDAVVAQFIEGLFAPDGAAHEVDVRSAIDPLVPVAVSEFAERGVALDPDVVQTALERVDTVSLDTGEAARIADVVDEAHAVITRVVLLALVAMLVAGVLAVSLAEERFAMIRTLGMRVVLAALSYAVMLRVASWALDPQRGRSPIAGGGSIVLGSNGHVLVYLAGAAAIVAVVGALLAWAKRRRVRFSATTPEDVGDDTRELARV